jgi:hypothetical protein
MTPEAQQALLHLRQTDHFQWYVVGLLAFVVYAYADTARRGEWDKVVLSLAFWSAEFVWEVFNGLVLHASGYAPLWATPEHSAYVIYVGLNVEIACMFAVAPLAVLNVLPADRQLRLGPLPARTAVPVAFGLFCVAVECVLNAWGALAWAWSWWRWPNVALIALAYCGPFVALVWLYDRLSLRAKLWLLLACTAAAIASHLLFAVALRWV